MSRETVVASDGVRLALHDLGGESPPVTLLVHGTSFHARVLAPLAASLGEWRCYGLDLRGHGASAQVAPEEFEWSSLGDDVSAALDWVAERHEGPIVGIGHSAGATALLLAASHRPDGFAHLFCYEPIVPAAIAVPLPLPGELAGAARRRARFESRDQALAYFSERPPLSGLDAAVLAEYVALGVVDDDEGVHLACDPNFEAAVYRAGAESRVSAELKRVDCPTTIAFGEASVGIGRECAASVAAALPRGDLVMLGGLGHLGPLEDPRSVAAAVITAFDTAGT